MSRSDENIDRVVKRALDAIVDAMEQEQERMAASDCLEVARGIYLSIFLATVDGMPDTAKLLTAYLEGKLLQNEVNRLSMLPDMDEGGEETTVIDMPHHKEITHGYSRN